MSPLGLYAGTSSLGTVARASAFSFGVVYGNLKLKALKLQAKIHKKAEAKEHH